MVIKKIDGSELYRDEATTLASTVTAAVAAKTDLRGANLRGAYLRGANLRGAIIYPGWVLQPATKVAL